jgi:dihydroorotase-like cyclic amidohydrolase
MSTNLYRTIMSLAVIATFTMSVATHTPAQDVPSVVTLFKNVKVFNGTENKLHDMDVLVVKNKIHKIAKDIPTSGTWEVDVRTGGAKQVKGPGGGLEAYTFNTFEQGKTEKKQVKVNVIDGGGRTLMPGLIDSHVHLNFYKVGTVIEIESATWEEIGARATV